MKFSVLISVYFKEIPSNLRESLGSILNQTVLPNEIVIIKDGPLTRELDEVIDEFCKIEYCRIKVISLTKNNGLAYALSVGALECSFDLIARMDSDDICFPNRFELQLEFLKKNDVDIVGGQIIEFGRDKNDVISRRTVPLEHNEIVKFMKFRSPFSHPTIMFKKKIVEALNGYSTTVFPEDYEFFVRAYLKGYKFANLSENLLYFRFGENRSQALKRRWGLKYAINEFNLLLHFYSLGFYKKSTFVQACLIRIPIRLLPFSIFKFIYSKFLR